MSSYIELCAQQNIPFWAKTSSETAVSTSGWQIQWWLDCHCWCKGSNYFGNVNLHIKIRKYRVYSSLSFLGPGAASTAATLMPATFVVSKKDVWMSRLTLSPKSAKPSACFALLINSSCSFFADFRKVSKFAIKEAFSMSVLLAARRVSGRSKCFFCFFIFSSLLMSMGVRLQIGHVYSSRLQFWKQTFCR